MDNDQKILTAVPKGIPDELQEFYLSLSEEDRESLEGMDTDLRNSILSIRVSSASEMSIETAATDMAADVRDTAKEETSKTQEQLRFQFAPFPTEMTRTSPFFPMSTKERSHREIIENMIIAHHSWGSIRYSGPKLSVSDEDTLIILLAFLNEGYNRKNTEIGGRATYMYRGSVLPLLRLKGIKRPGKNHYDDLINSLKLLGRAQFELITNRKNAQGNPAPKISIISGIVTGLTYDSASCELILAINPFFAETFATGNFTLLDVATRLKLDSQVAKSLYRFIQSHRSDEWSGHLMTLATSLNLDVATQPLFKLREIIKRAIRELIKEGTLTQQSCVKKDLIMLFRAPPSSPAKLISSGKDTPVKKTRQTTKKVID